MVEINLLPWRHYKRLLRKKIITQLLYITAIAFISITILLNANLYLKITHIKNNIISLQQRLVIEKAVNSSFAKHNIRDSALTREHIKHYQHHLINLLINMQQTQAPQCVRTIQVVKDKISITGYAASGVSISQYLLHWQSTHWFDYLNLTELKQHSPYESAFFSLKGKLKKYPVWNAQYELDQDIIEE